MRSRGVRRVPVVDTQGTLAGILSVDDLIELLSEELGALSRIIRQEQRHEQQLRTRP
ncbi:CBS domain-containing protein [Thiohalobacter thiocyanaticus]|uniref:CBS domain-containing protein n=1 Tax=Thiohalobacter thiocyanaticus TaxID=585455 RepID=UPI002699BD95|nr:CBS domain-containing protein [Thiohalobacter thiocyanaticus]